MAQHWRALAAMPEDRGSSLRTTKLPTGTYSSSPRGFNAHFQFPRTSVTCIMWRRSCEQSPQIYERKKQLRIASPRPLDWMVRGCRPAGGQSWTLVWSTYTTVCPCRRDGDSSNAWSFRGRYFFPSVFSSGASGGSSLFPSPGTKHWPHRICPWKMVSLLSFLWD